MTPDEAKQRVEKVRKLAGGGTWQTGKPDDAHMEDEQAREDFLTALSAGHYATIYEASLVATILLQTNEIVFPREWA